MRIRTTKRPLNQCLSCNHTWYPRGSDVSRNCPNCKGKRVKAVYPSVGGALGALGILVGVTFLVLVAIAPGDPDSEERALFASSDRTPRPLPVKHEEPPDPALAPPKLPPSAFHPDAVDRRSDTSEPPAADTREAQETTEPVAPTPPVAPALFAANTSFGGAGNKVVLQTYITNSGGSPATDIQLLFKIYDKYKTFLGRVEHTVPGTLDVGEEKLVFAEYASPLATQVDSVTVEILEPKGDSE